MLHSKSERKPRSRDRLSFTRSRSASTSFPTSEVSSPTWWPSKNSVFWTRMERNISCRTCATTNCPTDHILRTYRLVHIGSRMYMHPRGTRVMIATS
eukprot:6117685-Pyramimonas_sp.AAC.1